MKQLIVSLVVVALLAPGASLAQQGRAKPGKASAAKKIYCWEEGDRKVCGDALPASAAQAARTEINTRTGMVTRTVDRAPTREELDAQAQQSQQAQQGQEQTQAQRMLMAYGSEDAIQRAFDERVSAAKREMGKVAEQRKQLQKLMLDRLRIAANQELEGRKVASKVADAITSLRRQMIEQDTILERHQKGIDAIEAERQQALSSFRALLEPAPAAPPSETSTP